MTKWESASIGDICDVVNGGTPKTGVPEYWGGPHQWITPAEMGKRQTPYNDQTERTITDQGLQNSSARRLPPYSVILSSRAPIGHLVINTEPMATNQGCKGLVPRSRIDHKFLYYYLGSIVELLNDLGTGATFKELSGGKLKEVPVPVPPLPEQRRIVAILDEAFEAIATATANTEKNLQNAREVFTSRVERVFSGQEAGWRQVALESIGVTQTGSTPKSSEPDNLGNYLPFVKPGDFNRDGSITFDNEGLSEIGARKARRVAANSALMVCIGATIGKAGFSEREIATNQQINSWTPTTETSAKFIYYQMTTSDFQRRVRQGAGQATLPIINKSKWSALTVVVPRTLDEQLKIVSDLDAVLAESMNLEAIYGQKLTALDELKKSLLHQAFTGQLTAKATDKQLAEVA